MRYGLTVLRICSVLAALTAVYFYLSGGRVMRRLGDELDSANRMVAELQTRVETLDKEAGALKADLKLRISESDSIRIEKNQWEGQSLLARQENGRLRVEIAGLKEQVAGLESEVERRVREVVALESRLSDPNTNPDALQARILAMEQQIDDLKAQASDARVVIGGLLKVDSSGSLASKPSVGRVLCRVVGRDQGRGFVVLEGERSPGWRVTSPMELIRGGKVIAKARVALVDSRLCVAELDPEFRKSALVGEGEYVEIAL